MLEHTTAHEFWVNVLLKKMIPSQENATCHPPGGDNKPTDNPFKSLTLRQIRDLNVESGSCVPHNIMNRMINKSRSELFSFSRKPPTHILIYELPHVVALCFFI